MVTYVNDLMVAARLVMQFLVSTIAFGEPRALV